MFGFGAKPAGTTASTTGTSSLFSKPATSSTPSLFGSTTPGTTGGTTVSLFGNTSTTSTTGTSGLFNKPATSTTSLFGTSGGTTGGSLFGNTGSAQPATGGSLFGNTGTTQPATGGSLFGNTGSTQQATGGLFGSAGRTAIGTASDDVKSLQNVILNTQNIVAAISNPKLYGDDRDASIALFNQLLAAVGTGKGYYEKDKNAVEFDHQNPFYQFKGYGYCALSHYKNSDGIVGLIVNESTTNFSTSQQKQKFIDGLYTILGNDPSLHAHFVDIRPITDTTCEIDIYVTKREIGRINSKQLYQYFEQKDKFVLIQQQLKVLKIVPKVEMDEADIKKYLCQPPKGFTETEWREAIVLNPEPKHLLPFAVYGFKELSERRQRQLVESEQQRKFYDSLIERKKAVLQELQEVDCLRKIFAQDATRLRHRILRIISTIYTQNTKNSIISIEEEKLANRVEVLSTCINGPNKLLDKLEKIKNNFKSNKTKLEELKKEFNNQHSLSDDESAGLKRYLNRRQKDFEGISKILKVNTDDVELMREHLR